MAMAISISPEGWDAIRTELEDNWTKEQLIEAISADVNQNNDSAAKNSLQHLQFMSQENLASVAFDLVRVNNTCDNDMNGYYIDQAGDFRVRIGESK